jgi:hypothetical protein
MADNIKIVGSILNTTQVSRYAIDDLRLIASQKIKKNFSPSEDYIEYYVYDIGDNLLDENYNYNKYKLPSDVSFTPGVIPPPNINNQSPSGNQVGSVSNLNTSSSYYPVIEIDPVQDLQDLGYSSGEFKVQYNIFKNKISGYPLAELFIKEISPDRTEVRAGSVALTNIQIETGSINLINSYNSSSYFDPFLLNFSDNQQAIVTNIVLNRVDTGYEILFKLYDPLDNSINEKTSLWVVEEISTPYMFDINLDAILAAPTGSKLRGPNFGNISRFGLNTTTTPYLNNFSNNQSGLLNQNNTQSIAININYNSDDGSTTGGFGSFVTFGSALSRIENFYNKVQQIESYNVLISKYIPYVSTTSSLQSEINSYSSSINNLITNFDGFENYLYFTSGSLTSSAQYGITPYPKTSDARPYTLFPITSSQAYAWYNASTSSAYDYDANNVNYFKYSVPSYVIDDTDNANYLIFLNMMGQYFDNIWIYVKSITDINHANNNLNIGISKDVVYNLLQSLGIGIFNSFGDQSVAQYLLGANTGSAYYSGSLVDFSATSSYLNNIPKKDILAESYKRIYHNLPLLLQRKGTVAGLKTLLSTFGIPNQNYYNVYSGSVTSSYYTPTGSNLITASVLGVNEYGGATKTQLLAGYNNDKVRIINSTATGSVLSPLVSIVQYTSESSKFRTADDHYVDVSFSPQTQINTYISRSISANDPSWILDNYIGDPRQLDSGSYNDLVTQRNIYFNGTGSFPGFTGSLMDYSGFIRLIQFFDNSLFKMLEDATPARINLTTGVSIESPVLERNKWSYARINDTSNISVGSDSISGSKITSPYNNYYNNLSGSKAAYFTGEISGSEIDIYNNYFLATINPWVQSTSSYNNGKSIYQIADYNDFLHSDFNILLNNVFENRYSLKRRTLTTSDYITLPAGISGSITGSGGRSSSGSFNILTTSSLQDSYLSLDSYKLPRHDGVKVSSLTYNNYSPSQSGWNGDVSFGKTAAIDQFVRKIGLFTQIVSSSFFPGRNTVSLKYLVDESGSLTELNQTVTDNTENHWAEVQNTFKLGTDSTVALFDNQQYSNQKTTDGEKLIFNSGYSYYPSLYYSGSDQKLYFQYVGKGNGILIHLNNVDPNFGFLSSISGSTLTPQYPVTSSTNGIYSIFDTLDNDFATGNSYYYNIRSGVSSSNYINFFPTYIVPQNANMGFSANFGVNLQFTSSAQTASYTFSIQYQPTGSSTSSSLASQIQSFTSSIGTLSTTLVFNVTSSNRDFVPGDQVSFRFIQNGSLPNNATASFTQTGKGTIYDGLRNSLSITTTGINPFATGSIGQFVSSSNGVDTLILNKSLSSFIDYQYLPSTSSIGLYNVYGNVNDTFSPKVGDVILIYYNSGSQYQEFNIVSTPLPVNGQYQIKVSPSLVSNLALTGSYAFNTVDRFLLLSKQLDETNLYLSFNKRDGQTSYGFLIPDNLSPEVLKNIDLIARQVQQKLLSSPSSGITINTV